MLIRSQKGQGLAEYALILALIAIVCHCRARRSWAPRSRTS